MTAWSERTLDNVIKVKHGFAFRGEHFRETGELIVLTPGNFLDGGGFKAKSGKEKCYVGPFPRPYLLRKGDVVLAMTEQMQGLLGSTATIPEDGRYLHNQRIGLIQILDESVLDLRFCYHLFNCPPVREQIQATATGSKVRHTAPERLAQVRVALPDLNTQRAVARILDSIDDLIENNQRRIGLLEQMAQAIYREWFVKFRYPGHEHATFVDSPLGPIPSDWSVSELKDVSELDKTGIQPMRYPEEWFDHFSIPAFDDGMLPAVDSGESIKSGKFLLKERSVMVSKLNPRIERTWLAAPDPGRRAVTSTEFLILRPTSGVPVSFLYGLVRSDPC